MTTRARVRRAPKRLEVIYRLQGEVKEVDVFRLAPALLHTGRLLQEAHVELGAEHNVGVNVKPFGRGSFVADIVLFVQSNVPLLLTSGLVVQAAMDKTIDVLAAIGMISSRTENLINAIKKLRGVPDKTEQIGPDEYKLSAGDNSITVHGDVNKLIHNVNIVVSTAEVFGKPGLENGVTGIETYIKNRPETINVIEREEAKIFEQLSTQNLEALEPTQEYTSRPTELALKPKRVAVEGESDNWSFRVGRSKDEVLRIDAIRDQEFLRKVNSGEYLLTKDVLLIADVIVKQRIRGNEIVSRTSEIIKVKEYRPPARHRQSHLFENDVREE